MKVFLAGSTGAVGKRLVPRLAEDGHDVTALVRSTRKGDVVEALGARAALADALDEEQLTAAIRKAEPEVIVHQLTAISGVSNFRRLDRDFALTNRLRTEVTNTMLAAGRAVGARRFIAQSFCGWTFAREGGPVKTENDPLDPNPPPSFRNTLAAIQFLEDTVRAASDIHATALRYGFFYGPGSGIARDGTILEIIRKRKMPIVGDGGGIWSFVHIDDVVGATVAAVTRGAPGIYNVVDDEPAPVSEWLPALAEALGAKPPYRVPVWLGRIAMGEGGVSMMTKIRGASNARARRELGLELRYPSWRRGFREGLG